METMNNAPEKSDAPSSLALRVASMPWAFSQQHPLDTAEFIREAEKRGVRLDALALRELYRVGLLVPFAAVTSRRVGQPAPIDSHEPVRARTRLAQLRFARDTGRLRATVPAAVIAGAGAFGGTLALFLLIAGFLTGGP
jgi:hypothetical protein